jgi:hypothetical protein
MEITEVTASFSRKKQVQQYEPLTVTESVTAEVGDDEDPDEVAEQLHDLVQNHVQARLYDIEVETDG